MHCRAAGWTISLTVAVALAGLTTGCKNKSDQAPADQAAAGSEAALDQTAAAAAEDEDRASIITGLNGEELEWVPAEHKKGMSKWKDSGIYLDGQLLGFVTFGELPFGLEPVWVEDEANAEFKPGEKRVVTEKQRHYRVTDYLRAMGVDVKKIKELHMRGPHATEVLVVSGKELQARGKEFYIRFGAAVYGKPIPTCPPDFGNRKCGDKLAAIMVYIEKEPPFRDREKGLMLDGKPVEGVPYHGDPPRGGVRVYKDNRWVATIKRRKLEAADTGRDVDDDQTVGKPGHVATTGLYGFLVDEGVDVSDVVEARLVHIDEYVAKLDKDQLASATFEASSQAKGEVIMKYGDKATDTHVIKLFTRKTSDKKLPQIMDWE